MMNSENRNRWGAGMWAWIQALRVHHWSKNLLLFIPIVLAHRWLDAELMLTAGLAFLLLLVVTSSTYLVNDVLDLASDRAHDTKQTRAIASGRISVSAAIAVAAILIPTALWLAFMLDVAFGLVLSAYVVVTLAYSVWLKAIALFDLLLIAVLFTLRIGMGSALLDEPPPEWLLTFSMFLFYSLASAKRYAELVKAGAGNRGMLAGRGYQSDDAALVMTMGLGAGLVSLAIMILYFAEYAFGAQAYSRPEYLWLITFCLAIWLGRVWLLSHRGMLREDPVSFALKDPYSFVIGLIVIAAFLLSL